LITSNSTTGTPLKGLIELYGKFRRTITSRAYVKGLGIAIEAVENGYESREVRRRSPEIERKLRRSMGRVRGTMAINEYGSAYLLIDSWFLNDCCCWF
jgi:hypothetical protein